MVITRASLRSASKSISSNQKTLADMPDEVFEQILRNTSSIPSHPEWKQFVSLEDAISSFKTCGALSRAASRMFSSVSSNFSFFEKDGNRLILRSDDVTEERDCTFLRFMETAGHSITHISLKDDDLSTIGDEGRELLLQNCKNVAKAMFHLHSNLDFSNSNYSVDAESGEGEDGDVEIEKVPQEKEDVEEDDFDIFSFFTKFMWTRSGELKALHLNVGKVHKEYIDAIAEHGSGIEELHITSYELPNDSDSIWATVGPSLETLKIEILNGALEEDAEASLKTFKDVLTGISENCSAIRRLTVQVEMPTATTEKAACRSIISVCEAYGEQLEYLCLDCSVPPEVLSSFCKGCPNAHVDIWAPIEEFSIATLKELHNNVCTLDYSIDDKYKYGKYENEQQKKHLVKKVEHKHFISAARGCRYLEEISINLPGVLVGPLLSAFLSTPKDSLKHVKLDLYKDPLFYDKHVYSIMQALSQPNSIETFTLEVACARLHSFNAFARASPNMRKVNISFQEELDFEDFEAIYVDIIRAFSLCSKLESLVIENPCLQDLIYSRQPTDEVDENGEEMFELKLKEERKPEDKQSKKIREATKKLRLRGVYVAVNYVPY